MNRSCSVQAAKMEGSRHINLNNVICRKRAIYRTEIERPLLAAKGFNTNLVQFLPPFDVIILLFHMHDFPCAQTCT